MYEDMFGYVKKILEDHNAEETRIHPCPFRKRSEHIKRVCMWAERITDCGLPVNKEAVMIASVFHDSGYALAPYNSSHAQHSAEICRTYLQKNGYEHDFIDQVTYLVENHSNKHLMTEEDTPLELILLMEADLLDETGALSVIWDCMSEGLEQEQSFEKTYLHIQKYSYGIMKENPMITPKAKVFWIEKQKLVQEFVDHLSFDLGFD